MVPEPSRSPFERRATAQGVPTGGLMVRARQILGIAGALAAAWNPTSSSERASEWHEVSHSTTRAPILASLLECSPCSFRIRPLVRHRPTEPLEVFFDVQDRKSTRLNSSHLVISYAVFCLKKKTHNH